MDISMLRKQIAALSSGADLDALDALIAVLDEEVTALVERRDAMVEAARLVGVPPSWAVNRFAQFTTSGADRKAEQR